MPHTIPFLRQLPNAFTPILLSIFKDEGYSRQDLVKDLLAGLIVGVISLPLAIAFAIASGVAPSQGLITAVIAGALTAMLGGSRVQVYSFSCNSRFHLWHRTHHRHGTITCFPRTRTGQRSRWLGAESTSLRHPSR